MTASSCQHVYTLHVEHNTPFVPPWYNLRTICCSKSSSTSSKLKPSESKTSNTACRWCSQRMKHMMRHWNFTKTMQDTYKWHLNMHSLNNSFMTSDWLMLPQHGKKIEWVMPHVYISIFSNIYHPKVRPDGPLQKDHLPPPKDAISHHTQSMQVWRLDPVFGLQRVTLLWSALKASAKKKRNIFKRILWLEEQGVFISRYAPPLNNHRRPPFLGQHSPRRQC